MCIRDRSVPGSARPNLTLGFSKASSPGSRLRSASSKMRNKREPTSSKAILSSPTASANYAEPSKPNKPAHIVPAPSPRALQPHRRSCTGGASGLPTNCRPRLRFPRVPSSEPDPTLGTGQPRKSREHRRLRALAEPHIAEYLRALSTPGVRPDRRSVATTIHLVPEVCCPTRQDLSDSLDAKRRRHCRTHAARLRVSGAIAAASREL